MSTSRHSARVLQPLNDAVLGPLPILVVFMSKRWEDRRGSLSYYRSLMQHVHAYHINISSDVSHESFSPILEEPHMSRSACYLYISSPPNSISLSAQKTALSTYPRWWRYFILLQKLSTMCTLMCFYFHTWPLFFERARTRTPGDGHLCSCF